MGVDNPIMLGFILFISNLPKKEYFKNNTGASYLQPLRTCSHHPFSIYLTVLICDEKNKDHQKLIQVVLVYCVSRQKALVSTER